MVNSSCKEQRIFIDVGDDKAATITGIPVRKERRNKQCFQLLRHIRAYFPFVSDYTVSGKQSLPEMSVSADKASPDLLKHNPPDGGKIQL